ncbi:alpha/beta fold hydrolase [[Clostridium] hylemonae]|uniref:alpha/beta fold hydrolase n=1 Tax=[Clostridium] hylemonae TaxID=89153 RepID=UPI001FCBADD2|nr:alpha/beta fold hydrolase [[Clostridium] hylemonae]BDF06551.1 hypothetical protein CE91St63_36130 [[Clostridium] hylemonae]
MSWKKKLAAGTALTGAAAVTIHMINKFIYFSATLDDLLSNPSGSYYEWRFGKIYYTKKGEGKPLLLIHDLTTYSSAYEWNKTVDELSKKYTVFSIDLLGCGRSDKPNLTYTNYMYVQLITDFIKHVIGDKTDVIATGESGSFVLAACQNDSSIIDQIVLVNPASIELLGKIPTKRSKCLSWFINTPILGTFVYNMLTKRKDIEALFQMDYFDDSDNVDDDIIRTYYESAHSGNASSKFLFASIMGYYTTINIPHCLESLSNSIYIVAGKSNQDNIDFANDYKDILPSIEIVEMDNTKYLPQLEKPAEFLEQLNILLSSEE